MERLGRYEVLEELGHGAMGRVYRGRAPQIDRIVALKTIDIAALDPAVEEEFRQRFFREAQAAGRLSHPGIVTIYDAGEDPASQTPFIVMENIEGQTLEELGRGERLPRERALELVGEIAEALDYAHGQKVIHRDIKPSNILVTAQGRAKITDFGIAKVQTAQFTQTGQVLGTRNYMVPEQLTGRPVDGRADLFPLGMVLYWLLTGEKPFAGESMATLTFKIVYLEPLAPTRLNPALGPDFDYVIHRALAKDPDRRYQRGREVADDLDDLAAGRPPRSRAVLRAPLQAKKEKTEGWPPWHPPVKRPGTEPLAASPLAGEAAASPAWALAWLGQRRRVPTARLVAALLLLLLGARQVWGPKPTSTEPPSESGAATPIPVTPLPTATLGLQGENPFKEATHRAYADGKLIRQARLRAKAVRHKVQS